MKITFAVLGAGAWGTAVAILLAQNPRHRVRLWSRRTEIAEELNRTRDNARLLPGVRIPDEVAVTADIAEAIAGAELWIAAIPTVYLRATLAPFCDVLSKKHVPIVSLAKGVEIATFRRPTEILHELLGTERLAVLSGPSHAEEVARGLPASVVVASRDLGLARWVQQRFTTDRFRVYTNQDVIGVELAGALKNVIGIAAGICDGLQFGDNTKAALLTRGLVEMIRFGVATGADPATFYGLAGVGDMITTCMSRFGRNRRVGERLAKSESLTQILASTAMVAEGVYTTRSLYERTQQMGVLMPILSEVYHVLYEGKSPHDAVASLMQRELVSEHRGL